MNNIVARAIVALAIQDPDDRDWEVTSIYHEFPETREDQVEWYRMRCLVDGAYYGGSSDRERRGF